jgi:hypothetical protein
MATAKPRAFNRRQALENQAFLQALARSGNARLAARELGVHRATFTKRRASHPAFAAEWDAALALAHATLKNPPRNGAAGRIVPQTILDHAGHGQPDAGDQPQAGGGGPPQGTHLAKDPTPQLVRLANGRHQLRAPSKRRLTRDREQAFLMALSATANVRLSARAAGFSHSAFYRHAERNPGFAREMRLALQMGYDRIELALVEGFAADSHRDDAWRHNDPPPIPAMTAAQALQALYLHQKEARLWSNRPDRKKRRSETHDQWAERLARKWEHERHWDREQWELEKLLKKLDVEVPAHEPPPPVLPALDQVTGWSKADPTKTPHDRDRALFGGWRLKDWEERDG